MSEDASEVKETPSGQAPDEAAEPDEPAKGEAESGEGTTEVSGEGASDEATEEPGDALRERIERWCAEIARDWSRVLTKEVTAQVGELTRADDEGLADAVARQPIALEAAAKFEAKSVPLMIMASEDAVLEVARTALGADSVSELDENAMSAFGELARQICGSLEAAWIAEGLEGLVIDAAEPGKLEKTADEFVPGDVCATLAMSLEGNGEIPLMLVLGKDIVDLFESHAEASDDADAVVHLGAGVDRILNIDVPITVEIARRAIKMKEVLAFKPGTVLEFDKKSEDLLDLLAGRARIGKGEAVKVGESFGMRVLEIGCLRERIQSLKQ